MASSVTSGQVLDLLSQIVRVGTVAARQPEKLRVRVEFRDTVTASLVTDWMQVLVPRAKEDRHYDVPDIGDQVLCLFLPFGRERGFVLGAMYAADPPPVADGDKWHRAFKDGTFIEYDRRENRLTARIQGKGVVDVEAQGEVTVKAKGKIRLESPEGLVVKAPTITLAGNLLQEGYDGDGAVSVLRGSFTVREGGIAVPDQDVSAGVVSLRRHEHVGVESGPDTSGAPVGG